MDKIKLKYPKMKNIIGFETNSPLGQSLAAFRTSSPFFAIIDLQEYTRIRRRRFKRMSLNTINTTARHNHYILTSHYNNLPRTMFISKLYKIDLFIKSSPFHKMKIVSSRFIYYNYTDSERSDECIDFTMTLSLKRKLNLVGALGGQKLKIFNIFEMNREKPQKNEGKRDFLRKTSLRQNRIFYFAITQKLITENT
ncbi:hypothetical protein AGLY_007995 [Aphis glycines]|uniref:Uncharacterized protein n=1 Tax=Aphis glycines TaxID=307491 RepID=A0A6G0TP64_APHGL|nr:hypothetical protein AGLY_007995 [Aphis glycines]